MRTEVFDAEAEKILRHAYDNSAEFQKSVADYSARKESSIGLVTGKIAEIDARLYIVVDERQKLDKRLSFLLDDDDLEMAQSFRDEYKRQFSALKDEEMELEDRRRQLQLLQKQLAEAQAPSKNGGLKQVTTALGYIRKKDFISLRSIYRQLFHKIIVHPLDSARVELEFVLRNLSTPPYGSVASNCLSLRRMGLGGLEPPTSRLSGAYSNQLSYRPRINRVYSNCSKK